MKRLLFAGIVLAVAACADGPATDATTDGVPANPPAAATDAASAADASGVVWVDVRRPDEWARGHVEGAIHIPLAELPERWPELASHRDDRIMLYCRTGNRSGQALRILEEQGFPNLVNAGGLSDLERDGVPVTR